MHLKKIRDHIKDIKFGPNLTCFCWNCICLSKKWVLSPYRRLGTDRDLGDISFHPYYFPSPVWGHSPSHILPCSLLLSWLFTQSTFAEHFLWDERWSGASTQTWNGEHSLMREANVQTDILIKYNLYRSILWCLIMWAPGARLQGSNPGSDTYLLSLLGQFNLPLYASGFFFLIYLLIMLLQLSHFPPLHSTPSLPHSPSIVHVHGSYL